MNYTYTREMAHKALERIGEPCHDIRLLDVWKEIADIEKIKVIEGMTGVCKDSDDGLLMILRAAVLDLINDGIVQHNKDGLLVLTEWLPDAKRLRSLDDGWDS